MLVTVGTAPGNIFRCDMYVSWNASHSGNRLFEFAMTAEKSESGELAGRALSPASAG
ncbi:hypothetical protein SAMN05216276_11083 [Streptosporangium subroseum]|uniref:Uncharacterized protein n=1 Tax=Streptosporangium subroseum TaxID=106412 RepID=A0A239PAP9_9ACTN|nr:hypothetical protein [Streptosporangium subroseum]SNT63953.1 hypothetical protein SAMN05216276_11083 [Streptosporangium subroseum]